MPAEGASRRVSSVPRAALIEIKASKAIDGL